MSSVNGNKKVAMGIITKCARDYKEKLLNKKVLIIYKTKNSGNVCCIEVFFHENNFQHLTKGLARIPPPLNELRRLKVEG